MVNPPDIVLYGWTSSRKKLVKVMVYDLEGKQNISIFKEGER